MKLEELKKQQSELEKILGFDPMGVAQQSDAWSKMKLGVISASKAKQLIAKPSTQTYKTFIDGLVAEVGTGMRHHISAASLDWGNDNEDGARSAYEFYFKVNIIELPFIYGNKEMRYGCSPDGLIVDKDNNIIRGAEIKSPYNSTNHAKLLREGEIKKEHYLQCQFSMFVTGLEQWDYCSYDYRFKKNQLIFKTFERDEKLMAEFKERIEMAVNDIDEILAKLDIKFKEQWG